MPHDTHRLTCRRPLPFLLQLDHRLSLLVPPHRVAQQLVGQHLLARKPQAGALGLQVLDTKLGGARQAGRRAEGRGGAGSGGERVSGVQGGWVVGACTIQ